MSVQKKMTAIADAIREKTGGTDALTLDAMAAAIPDVYEAGKGTSRKRYFAETVSLTERQAYIDLPIDFIPDSLTILTTDSESRDTAATQVYQMIIFLPTTESFCGAAGRNTTGGSAGRYTAFYGTSSGTAFAMLSGTETGYRISAGSTSGIELFFDSALYTVTATKVSDKSDKEMLTEYVHSLSDTGGNVYVLRLMRDAAFTEDEWDALVATKPSRTFVLQ